LTPSLFANITRLYSSVREFSGAPVVFNEPQFEALKANLAFIYKTARY